MQPANCDHYKCNHNMLVISERFSLFHNRVRACVEKKLRFQLEWLQTAGYTSRKVARLLPRLVDGPRPAELDGHRASAAGREASQSPRSRRAPLQGLARSSLGLGSP